MHIFHLINQSSTEHIPLVTLCVQQEKVSLLKQLDEANREAQKYRQQFLKKEQEAEVYRQKLEAITRQRAKKTA